MRSRDFIRALLAVLVCAPLLHGQSVRERLRRMGIEVTTSSDSTENQRAARPGQRNRNIPDSSRARPELFGLVLGKTTPTEAREVLSRATPELAVSYDETRALGVFVQGGEGGRTIALPDSTYTVGLWAKSKAYLPFGEPLFGGNLNTPCTNVTPANGNCETHWVVFSRPPRPSVLVYYRRYITFAPRPLLSAAQESILERMGAPSHRFEADPQGPGGVVRWTWIYGADGVVARSGSNPPHGCGGQTGYMPASPGDGQDARGAEGALQSGCAAFLRVEMRLQNGFVVEMGIDGGDLHTNHFANIAFVAQQDSVKQAFLESERGAASKARLPWP